VGEDKGIPRIEGNNRLDIDTLIAMLMIKPQPGRFTFGLKINAPHILFVLPNPPRTDPRWQQICYILVLTNRYKKTMVLAMKMKGTCKMNWCTMSKKSGRNMISGHGSKMRFIK